MKPRRRTKSEAKSLTTPPDPPPEKFTLHHVGDGSHVPMPLAVRFSDLPLVEIGTFPEPVKRPRNVSERTLTAVHEAGHAAMALRKGMRVDFLAVDRGDESVLHRKAHAGIPTGITHFTSTDGVSKHSGRAFACAFAQISLAGLAAESIAKGEKKGLYPSTDYLQCMEALSKEYRDRDEAFALAQVFFFRARAYLVKKWPLVEALASALKKKRHLTSGDVEVVVASVKGKK